MKPALSTFGTIPMKNLFSFVLFVMLVLMATVLSLAFWKFIPSPQQTMTVTSQGPTIERLERLSSLVTTRVYVADVLVGEGAGCRGSWLIRGDALLGVDLTQAEVGERNVAAKTARILLPPPAVLHARVDHERTRVWEVKTTTWIPWKADQDRLRDEVMREAQRLVGHAAGSAENIAQAKAAAETILTRFYAEVGWAVTQPDHSPGATSSAESATTSVDEAKEILALMDELGYSWIEGPLPPTPFDQQIPKYVELMRTGAKQRIPAEGPRSLIGDGTSFEATRHWAEAGAISQCSTDVYITGCLTHALRMIEYAKSHPPLVINLHWAWMPHAHLAMACDDKLMPLVEFPMDEDFPKSLLDGPYLRAPDWPGIYKLN
jgi:hypothetical protein